jgi:hypothetical protein
MYMWDILYKEQHFRLTFTNGALAKNEKYRESVLLFVMGKKVRWKLQEYFVHLNNDIISGKTNFLSYHRSYTSQVKSTIIHTNSLMCSLKFLFFKQAFFVLQQSNISTRLKNVQTNVLWQQHVDVCTLSYHVRFVKGTVSWMGLLVMNGGSSSI